MLGSNLSQKEVSTKLFGGNLNSENTIENKNIQPLGPVYTSYQGQCCDDTSNTALI